MFVNTNKRAGMVLVFAMDIMKKNVSSTLRENHGIIQGKKMMKTYKSVIKVLEDELVMHADDADEKMMDFEFTDDEFEMTKAFIKMYLELEDKRAADEDRGVSLWYEPLQNFMYAMIIAESSNEPVVV